MIAELQGALGEEALHAPSLSAAQHGLAVHERLHQFCAPAVGHDVLKLETLASPALLSRLEALQNHLPHGSGKGSHPPSTAAAIASSSSAGSVEGNHMRSTIPEDEPITVAKL